MSLDIYKLHFISETTILEDSTLDTPDTPGCCEETAADPKEEDASTNEQSLSESQKEDSKKEKSSTKSKAHRPHHLKLPKALQRSFSAQSNGNQQAKCRLKSASKFLVCLRGEYSTIVWFCGNTT